MPKGTHAGQHQLHHKPQTTTNHTTNSGNKPTMVLQTDPTQSSSPAAISITIILFAIVTYLLYKFVLSPEPTEPTAARNTTSSVIPHATPTSRSSTRGANSHNNVTSNAASDEYFSCGTHRHPSHLDPPEKWDRSTSLSKYLSSGIVPFRSTHAAGYETNLQEESPENEVISNNRKDRARIFAKLFSLTAPDHGKKKPPPNRGANIVVTVYPMDAGCKKLQKALMLLGTYYNLFVLVDGVGLGGKPKEHREFVTKFREEMLNANKEGSESMHLNSLILPPHRIILLSTSAGRVAFVRQLSGVELIVDGDEKVTKELERFGHRVLVYPKVVGGDGSSALGKFLIP